MKYAENLSNNEEGVAQQAPLMEHMSFITHLKESNRTERQLQYSQMSQDVSLLPESRRQIQSEKPFLTLPIQLLIFRFHNKLRSKSGNIAIDSVQPKYLRLLNDLSADHNSFVFKGRTIQRLINFTKQVKTDSFDLKGHLLKIYEKIPIVSPNSKPSLFLDIIIVIFTLIQLILAPLILTFDIQIELLNQSQLFLYSIFSFDCFRSLITGIYIDGNLILDRFIILKKYISNNLLMDTIAVFLYWFMQSQEIVRMLFLLRFQKINQILTKFELAINLEHQNYITLIKSIFLMLFGTHLMSCIQILIQNSTHTQWGYQFKLQDDSIITRYIHSLYWAVQTMVSVGYGDIVPTNNLQMLYTNLIMFIGCCIFGYVMNSIGNILSLMNEKKKNYSSFQKIRDSYFSSKPITPELLANIKSYSENNYAYQQSHNNVASEILNVISEELHFEFRQQINGRIVYNNTFLTSFSIKLQNKIVQLLEEQQYLPTDLIENETVSLYILDIGSISLIHKKMLIEKYTKQYSNINVKSFITGVPEDSSYYSDQYTSLYLLKRKDMINILYEFEDDQQLFYLFKDKLIFNNLYSVIQQSCSVCQSPFHQIKFCPQLHFIPNKKKLFALQNKAFQDRIYYLRSKIKTKTLINLQKIQTTAFVYYEDNIESPEELILNYNQSLLDEPILSFRQLSQNQLKEINSKVLFQNYSNESNININGKSIKQISSLNNKQIDNQAIPSLDQFDVKKEFKIYFPNNNCSQILLQLNKNRRKDYLHNTTLRQSFRKQLFVRNFDLEAKKSTIRQRMSMKLSTPNSFQGRSPLIFEQTVKSCLYQQK